MAMQVGIPAFQNERYLNIVGAQTCRNGRVRERVEGWSVATAYKVC